MLGPGGRFSIDSLACETCRLSVLAVSVSKQVGVKASAPAISEGRQNQSKSFRSSYWRQSRAGRHTAYWRQSRNAFLSIVICSNGWHSHQAALRAAWWLCQALEQITIPRKALCVVCVCVLGGRVLRRECLVRSSHRRANPKLPFPHAWRRARRP